MMARVKEKIATRKLKKICNKGQSEVHFNDFIKNSISFAFILPEDNLKLEDSLEVVRYFKIHKKSCTVFLLETSYNLVNIDGIEKISYNKLTKTLWGLPGKEIMNLIDKKNFDVLINLNTNTDIFLCGIIALINAKYKIGWDKDFCTVPYNFRIKTDEIISENYYRNLLNSLAMF